MHVKAQRLGTALHQSDEARARGRAPALLVTQTCSLPYRRLAVGSALDISNASDLADAPQIENLRYGRVKLCVTIAAHLDASERRDAPLSTRVTPP